MTDLLRETRDSQIRMEERMASMDKRLADLEATRSRLGWGVLGALGAALASLFTVVVKGAPVLLAAILLAGCVQTRSANQYRAVGTLNGQAVELTVQGTAASDTGVDPIAAVQGTLAALRGDLAGVSAAVAAIPPPAPPLAPDALESAVRKAAPPPPATVTGNALMDSALAALAAYLAGKGGLAGYRTLKTRKA